MQPLFGSEIDGIQEKIGETSIKKKKLHLF